MNRDELTYGGYLFVHNKGELIEQPFNSKFLDETISLIIYLPEKYTPLKKYPVLFVQDGYEYLNLGRLATQLDHLSLHMLSEDIIMVAIPTQNKEDRNAKYSPSGAKHEAYLRFLAEELVSFIDREYSTLCLGGSRAIMGDSLGAVVSLHAVLRYPHTFSILISQSALYLPETADAISKFNEKGLLQIYLSVGNQEEHVETSQGKSNLVQMNNDLMDSLMPLADVTFRVKDGNHTWGTWQPDIRDAILHFWGV